MWGSDTCVSITHTLHWCECQHQNGKNLLHYLKNLAHSKNRISEGTLKFPYHYLQFITRTGLQCPMARTIPSITWRTCNTNSCCVFLSSDYSTITRWNIKILSHATSYSSVSQNKLSTWKTFALQTHVVSLLPYMLSLLSNSTCSIPRRTINVSLQQLHTCFHVTLTRAELKRHNGKNLTIHYNIAESPSWLQSIANLILYNIFNMRELQNSIYLIWSSVPIHQKWYCEFLNWYI